MKYCLYCFLPEDVCCQHKYVEFPDNCFCDKGEWLSFKDDLFKVNEICNNYVPCNSSSKQCANCEHDEDCHSPTASKSQGKNIEIK